MQSLAKFIFFKCLGWRIVGNSDFSKNRVKKAILIAAPHTSWHDFYIGILIRAVVQFKSNFIAKKELFVFPLGWFLRTVGGSPINRQANENKVDAIAKLFDDKEEFRIALAPEGTRQKVETFRSGFYYIAKKAQVPIIMFTLDYENKQTKVSEPFYPSENIEDDFKYIYDFFKDVKGKIVEFS
ncbi:acyltransferase [Tamlana haliotis]|uniref:Acyltransferase n=2 Tax=Pseudotamlana haliotis TaxID=2614804 RepID=A0A6N6MPX3_9FLAO|nr:acyltransferase [Tamlana haliotis]